MTGDISAETLARTASVLRISGIRSAEIPEYWHLVEPLVAAACQTARGKWDAGYIRSQLECGAMQLWLITDGTVLAACITEIVQHPGKRCCRIRIMAGRQRHRWQHLVEVIEAWARAEGCGAMELIARPGWSRLLKNRHYEVTHLFCEKELH